MTAGRSCVAIMPWICESLSSSLVLQGITVHPTAGHAIADAAIGAAADCQQGAERGNGDWAPWRQRVIDVGSYCVPEDASCGVDSVQVLLVLLGKPLLQLLGAVLAQAMAQALLNLLENLQHVASA